jgi:hypothetical protein
MRERVKGIEGVVRCVGCVLYVLRFVGFGGLMFVAVFRIGNRELWT